MTPQKVLAELLNRLEASRGVAVHIGGGELSEWPANAVAALKSARLLVKTRPASSIVCPGCERECTKSVEVYPAEDGRPARAYIYCDEPEDMGRIEVEPGTLEQWRITGGTLAGAMAQLLGFTKPPEQDSTGKWWALGLLKGNEHKGAIKFAAENGVALYVAGHTVPLTEILSLDNNGLTMDRSELQRLVDKPAHTLGAPAYEPSIARREARKLDTQQRYGAWRKAAKELRRNHRGKSERWVSLQIAKMDIANGSSEETIRKHMRQ
jgi:hypothetical protein